jgi:hypothetical protein
MYAIGGFYKINSTRRYCDFLGKYTKFFATEGTEITEKYWVESTNHKK